MVGLQSYSFYRVRVSCCGFAELQFFIELDLVVVAKRVGCRVRVSCGG